MSQREIKESLLEKIVMQGRLQHIHSLLNYDWTYGEKLLIKHAEEKLNRGEEHAAKALIEVLLCAYFKDL